jgi:hypothetical protein
VCGEPHARAWRPRVPGWRSRGTWGSPLRASVAKAHSPVATESLLFGEAARRVWRTRERVWRRERVQWRNLGRVRRSPRTPRGEDRAVQFATKAVTSARGALELATRATHFAICDVIFANLATRSARTGQEHRQCWSLCSPRSALYSPQRQLFFATPALFFAKHTLLPATHVVRFANRPRPVRQRAARKLLPCP